LLLIWLDPKMNWRGQPSGKRGRSEKFSDQAIQFCLSIKCVFNLPLRQAMGTTQSLLRLAGLDWPVPDYSTVSRRQKPECLVAMLNHPRIHRLVNSGLRNSAQHI
jgi:hypothetical protein